MAFLAAWLHSCLSESSQPDSAEPELAPSYFARLAVPDSSILPDSILYRNRLDSGTAPLSRLSGSHGAEIAFFPRLHPMVRDSLRVDGWKHGIHVGQAILRSSPEGGDLTGVFLPLNAQDTLAGHWIRQVDSLRASRSNSRDSGAWLKDAAALVLAGSPWFALDSLVPPSDADTAGLRRAALEMAAASGKSLAEIIAHWSLRKDLARARQAFGSAGLDSSSLHALRMVEPLRLDTLHPGDPGIGLKGAFESRFGIGGLQWRVMESDRICTSKFLLDRLPSLGGAPRTLKWEGSPRLAATPAVDPGEYRLELDLWDTLGNRETFLAAVHVGAALDHRGPLLKCPVLDQPIVRAFDDSILVLSVEASDTSGVRSVTTMGHAFHALGYRRYLDTVVVPIGPSPFPLVVLAVDSVGNVDSIIASFRREAAPPPVPPRIRILTPSKALIVPFDSSAASIVLVAQGFRSSIDSVTIAGRPAARISDTTWGSSVPLVADGSLHSFGISVFASNGLASSDSVQLGRSSDRTGPRLTWKVPRLGDTLRYDQSSFDVVVGATGGSGVDSVLIGGSTARRVGEDWQASLPSGLPGRAYSVRVSAFDKVGNHTDTSFSILRQEVPATIPPRLSWIQPSRQDLIVPFDSASLEVLVSVADFAGIDSGSVRINGMPASHRRDSIWAARINLAPTGLPTIVSLEAKSVRGSLASAFLRIVRLRDTIPPAAKPLPGTQSQTVPYSRKSIELAWVATDNDRVDRMEIGSTQATGQNGVFRCEAPLAVGSNLIPVAAFDPAGLRWTDTLRILRLADSTPPDAQRLPGTRNKQVSFETESISVGWFLSDDDQIAQAWIQDTLVPMSNGEAILAVQLRVGLQWLRIRTCDPSGNWKRDSIQVERLQDTTKPHVSSLQGRGPMLVPWDSATARFSWQVTDNSRQVQVWIDGTAVASTSDTFLLSVPLSTKERWIKIRAQDLAGNVATDSILARRDWKGTVAPLAISDTNSSLRSGWFTATLSCSTPRVEIHYTIDGSDPTLTTPLFGADAATSNPFTGVGRFVIDSTVVVKARAWAPDMAPSPILRQEYKMAVPIAVSGGLAHTLFLLSDGTLWGTGTNLRNAFSDNLDQRIVSPILIDVDVVQISAGNLLSLWVKRDGSLWGIGANDSGALGIGSRADQVFPVRIATGVRKAGASPVDQHIAVLMEDNTLWTAGNNSFGQLGTGDLLTRTTLTRIATDVVDFSCGPSHTLFTKLDGSLWGVGSPYWGKFAIEGTGWVTLPLKIADSVAAISPVAGNTTIWITRDQRLLGVGANDHGELGNGTTQYTSTPSQLEALAPQGTAAKILHESHTLVLRKDGSLWASGWNQYNQIAYGASDPSPTPRKLMEGIRDIGIGAFTSFAITNSGALYAWGISDQSGVLGLGLVQVPPSSLPARVRF